MQTLIINAIQAIDHALTEHEAEIAELDRAIGDGDHYINIKRGVTMVQAMQAELLNVDADIALQKIGMKLMSTVGGASGVLIGGFFMAFGKHLNVAFKQNSACANVQIAAGFAAGVESIRQRGKAELGEKTMLDVLIPVAEMYTWMAANTSSNVEIAKALKLVATTGMLSTKDLLATKGRAAFLGERSKGHIDAGAKSCEVMIHAVCDLISEGA